MLDQLFANLAVGFSGTFGGPFIDATATWPGTPIKDAGGSIVMPGTPVSLACKAQFDVATQAMRQAEGFISTDVRVLVLSATLAGTLDEAARIVVPSGPYGGTWALLSVVRDPAGIGWECRGRKIAGIPAAPPTQVGQLDFSDPANSGLLALLLDEMGSVATGPSMNFSIPANSGLSVLILEEA